MAKQIIIVRHAKSSWKDLDIKDKDRPLNARGKRDAPVMAQWCLENNLEPNEMLVSSSKRTRKTAEVFQHILGVGKKHISYEDSLYHASADKLLESVYGLSEKCKSALIVAHNPGITDFVNNVKKGYTDNIPTCGVVVFKSTAKSWDKVDFDNCKLVAYGAPKTIDSVPV